VSIPGVGVKTARGFIEGLEEPWKEHPQRIEAIIAGDPNILDSWKDERLTKIFLEMVKAQVAVVGGETDEPVTSDVKRLIRMPGSLHGKSSLKAISMTRDELDEFEPFRDALAFGDDAIQVEVLKEETCFIGGLKKYYPGTYEISENHAIFLMCRGAAMPAEDV
ncbi:MAG: hypothetical protein QCI38_04800, partial [Candidatus Thermoplasmatota archaeon]|nr:hypothetical protein [Candidatus Thermoplasmatota archaeon]